MIIIKLIFKALFNLIKECSFSAVDCVRFNLGLWDRTLSPVRVSWGDYVDHVRIGVIILIILQLLDLG